MQSDEMLFPIQSCPWHYFYAGHLPGGRQVLIGQCVDGYIQMAVFDRDGHFLEVLQHDLPTDILTSRAVAGFDVIADKFQEFLQREFGFVPGLIRVREFRRPADLFGVYRFPQFYQDFLSNPEDPIFGEEERQELPSIIEQWKAEGNFVVEWGNDFWLNNKGEAFAS